MTNVLKKCIGVGIVTLSSVITSTVISKSSDKDDVLRVNDIMYRTFSEKDKILIK